MKRRSMTNNGSKNYFKATASKTHIKNIRGTPMRGGIRL